VTPFQTFRFKTRLQRLNSIEASSRAKLNFLEQLYRFHKQQGNPRVAVPTINNKPLDLWTLRKEVHRMGGYDAVRYPFVCDRSFALYPLGYERKEVVGSGADAGLSRNSWSVDSAQEFLHPCHPAF
jgi:hypothetical protein